MFLRILLQQYHCVCADSLLASCEAELFGGGGFDGEVLDVDAHDIGESLLHLGDVWVELGTLCADGSIDVANGIAFGCYEVDGFAEKYLGVDVLELVAFFRREVVAVKKRKLCLKRNEFNAVDPLLLLEDIVDKL